MERITETFSYREEYCDANASAPCPVCTILSKIDALTKKLNNTIKQIDRYAHGEHLSKAEKT